MARLAGLIAAAALALAMAGGALAADPDRLKTPRTPWGELSADERRILEPVAPEWDGMPGYQQERLKSAARRYPSMRPIQQERFERRIRDWAAMSPEQRRAARETFQGLRRLPPEKQHELRERWLQRHRGAEESSEPRFRPRGGDAQRGPRSGDGPGRPR